MCECCCNDSFVGGNTVVNNYVVNDKDYRAGNEEARTDTIQFKIDCIEIGVMVLKENFEVLKKKVKPVTEDYKFELSLNEETAFPVGKSTLYYRLVAIDKELQRFISELRYLEEHIDLD